MNAPGPKHALMPAVIMAHANESNAPKYPRSAALAKIDGLVRLEAEVRTNGKVGNVKVLEGDSTLAEASTRAIRKWRFYPAQQDGKPVEDRVRINIVFRLDGEQVQAQVVVPDPASSDARK